jgi:predicted transcriptional regulator
MSHEIPTVGRETSLEEYGQQLLRTGRRCHLVISDGRVLGLMDVRALNSVPHEQWSGTSVQAAMIPRDRILSATPDQPLLPLLERMITADVNQVPVMTGIVDDVSNSQVVGIVTRESILRVIQTHIEVGMPAAA